jgi:hypothetical protein
MVPTMKGKIGIPAELKGGSLGREFTIIRAGGNRKR